MSGPKVSGRCLCLNPQFSRVVAALLKDGGPKSNSIIPTGLPPSGIGEICGSVSSNEGEISSSREWSLWSAILRQALIDACEPVPSPIVAMSPRRPTRVA